MYLLGSKTLREILISREGILGLAFVVFAIFHFSTLNTIKPGCDDAQFLENALYSTPRNFELIMPDSFKHHHPAFKLSYKPSTIKSVRLSVSLFGPGTWQIRLPNAIGGFLALLVISLLLYKLKTPFICQIGIIGIGFLNPFFKITHICRSEGILLFILSLNLYWLFLNKGRIIGFIVGFLASFGLTFWGSSILTIGSIGILILLNEHKGLFKKLWIYWWFAGLFLGVLVAASQIDFESLASSKELYLPTGLLMSPQLLFYKYDFWSIGLEGLKLLFKPIFRLHDLFFFTAVLSTITWQLRRYKNLRIDEKLAVQSSITIYFIYAALTASHGNSHHIYFYPVFFLVLFQTIEKIVRKNIVLDSVDLFLASLSLLTFFTVIWPLPKPLLPLLVLNISFLIRFSHVYRNLHKKWITGISIYLFLFVLSTFDTFYLHYLSILQEFKHTPWVFIFSFLIPWGLFSLKGDSISLMKIKKIKLNLFLLIGLIFAVSPFFYNNYKYVRTYLTDSSYLNQYEKQFLKIKDKRRVIAPGSLAIVYPSLGSQSECLFLIMHGLQFNYNLAKTIIDFQPTHLLLHEVLKTPLEKGMKKLSKDKREILDVNYVSDFSS